MSSIHDANMLTILRRLEMLSHGSTQAWNKSGGGSGEPDDRMVSAVARLIAHPEEPPHKLYRRLYDEAKDAEARSRIYEEAKRELDHWKRRQAPSEASVSIEVVLLEEGVGWDPVVVGQRFNMAPDLVRRIRQRNKRGTEDGRPVVLGESLADRVLELNREGLSQPQIAKRLGMSQSAVSRVLKFNRFRPAQMG